MSKILDGTALAAQMKVDISSRATQLRQANRPAKLAAILVDSPANASAKLYAQRQGKTCADVGIDFELATLDGSANQADCQALIDKLNGDQSVSGILLHLPLPAGWDAHYLQNCIAPAKDVEGVGAANLGYLLSGQPRMVPCTAQAAFELAKLGHVPLRGAEAVVVGGSAIVGKPVALLLSDQRATVQICRTGTSDLAGHCRRADILIVAVGKANMITAEFIKPGAVVVDVGINRISLPDGSKKTVGDVDFPAAEPIAGAITPVPGGVGPVTVAILLRNTVLAAENR